MVEHMTFVNFKYDNLIGKKQELIEKIQAFKEHIPGVVDSQAGDNFQKGFHFGISVRFKDRKAFEEYMTHPKHLEAASLMKEMGLGDLAVVDFEF